MNPPRRLPAAVVALALLLGSAACQSGTPDPQGSSVQTQNAQMPDLPDDPAAAETLVRKMLVDEAVALLKASGLKYTEAQFDVPTSFDDDKAQNGDLRIDFAGCTDADVQAMTDAIWAHGWKPGSISHGVHGRKGALDIQWGNGKGGAIFEITTVNIGQYLPGIKDVTQVPELAAFKHPAPAPGRTP